MAIEIQVAHQDGVTLAGVVRDGALTDLVAERREHAGLIGSVYVARVLRIDRAAGAAFLDIGLDRPAYLPLRAAGAGLSEGVLAIVQILAGPREDKGPEATLDIGLAGRLLLHLPRAREVAVARALGPEARRRWRDMLSGGWIVRTAAAAAPVDAVEAEAAALRFRWAEIERRAGPARGPALLERGPGVARRAALDHADAVRVRLDLAAVAADPALPAWLRTLDPALEVERGETDIPDLLPALLAPVVPLASGGSIVIEATRALTAIDVNAGAAGDPFLANREAAAEVARQLRLRNIGGIVVIDFISMRRRDSALLLTALARALDGDPAKLRLPDAVSPLGLVELARERRGPALAEALSPASAAFAS